MDDDRNIKSNRRTGKNDELSQRFEQLRSNLEHSDPPTQKHEGDEKAHSEETRNGIALAFRLSSEFIAGVVVGAGIGYGCDVYFGTSPWGMIVFLLLGFAAAVLNVMRAAGLVAESKMRLKPAHDMQNASQDDETGPEVKK